MAKIIKTDIVIVGSGPGGATIARELAAKGKDVVLLEKGRDHQRSVGSVLAYATMYDIKKSQDGILVRRGITTGGSTMLYSGNAYDPPAFLKNSFGIDLSSEVAETKEELKIKPVPEFFYRDYVGTKRLLEAANELGYEMTPQERFIDAEKCDSTCDRCLFGCKTGAKWTAREYIDDAVRDGAQLITRCDVKSVIESGGEAVGVNAEISGEKLTVYANKVVLSAGGIGTPLILQQSGIRDAGTHFFTDPMSVMVGVMKEGRGTFHEITYTFANEENVGEFVFGNVGAVNGFVAQLAALHFPYLLKGLKLKRLAGMFVKLCDEPTGRIDREGKIHKKFTDKDERTMARGVNIAKNIMEKAGVIPGTISIAKGIGGHPGGTAAIGRIVGTDLQVHMKNLFICDNSVMPYSGGIPPVLTLIALAKKTARNM